MKREIKILLKLFLVLVFLESQNFAQGTMKVETDKSNYAYGERIEVSVTILNDSDTSFTVYGSSSCMVLIAFNSVPFQVICTADERPILFPPHSARTWVWEFIPEVMGIPDKNGEQVIYGFGLGLRDSIIITAPKYYGGILSVGTIGSIPYEEYQSLRDSINAEVIDSMGTDPYIFERWKITGKSIDSLVENYSGDYRLKWIEVERYLKFIEERVTGTESINVLPPDISLSQNYPNPFNPSTTIKYSIPDAGFVTLKIYDVLGRELETLASEEKPAGNYTIEFRGDKLSSGIYFYQLKADKFTETKKMLLLK